MTGIEAWSTTAASNNAATPNGWPEGQAPSTVNDCARQNMASIRTWYEDAEWVNWGDTTAYVGTTQFKTAGVNSTSRYTVGRRVRAVGSSTGTIYGTITVSTFSTDTTVTVVWDSGSLSNETLTISVGILNPAHASLAPGKYSAIMTVKQQAFTSNGTYTPSTGMLYCIAEAVGGGGGGGGLGASASSTAAAGGGGSGAYAKSWLSATTVGASQTVTIGAGGTAGANTGGNGGTGGSTLLGSLLNCAGGAGGTGRNANTALCVAGGAGGAAAAGDIQITGNPGGGGIGIAAGVSISGYGANSPYGAGGIAVITTAIGNAGVNGGGGSGANQSASQAGGGGGAGYIVITEFCSQ